MTRSKKQKTRINKCNILFIYTNVGKWRQFAVFKNKRPWKWRRQNWNGNYVILTSFYNVDVFHLKLALLNINHLPFRASEYLYPFSISNPYRGGPFFKLIFTTFLWRQFAFRPRYKTWTDEVSSHILTFYMVSTVSTTDR